MSAALSSRFANWWNGVFHVAISPLPLGLFRALFGYCLFDEIRTSRSKSVFAIAGDSFHLPYFDWIPPITDSLYHTLHDVQYPLAVFVGLGLFTRLAGWPLLAIQAWIFFSDKLTFRNHPYFFMLVLMLLLLGPCDEAFSVRALIRGWRSKIPPIEALFGRARPAAFQRLIQLSVCVAYFYAGIHKAHPEYFSGRILRHKLEDEVMSRTSGDLLGALFDPEWIERILISPTSMMLGAWMTVIAELALPFMLWMSRARPAAMVIGIGFHLAIRLSMEITTFSYAMIGTYMLFLAPETVPRLARAVLRRFGVGADPGSKLDRSTAPRVK